MRSMKAMFDLLSWSAGSLALGGGQVCGGEEPRSGAHILERPDFKYFSIRPLLPDKSMGWDLAAHASP